MEAEQAVVAILSGATAVTDLVGHRIYPDPAPQDVDRPLITYWRVSAMRVRSHSGPSGLQRPRIQINCVAQDYTTAKKIGQAVRQALDCFKGVVDGITVGAAFLDNDRDERPFTTGRHIVQQDYLIWCEETV